ncbi:MADS-box protein FLOWERING LOCUS C-like [Hibiscus syriacus]|uniref:MADS-box protein FLOWERING LOCUS C-like n=1 Tax=Hibiscus syriacus TaxID=106335 RepID=UPI0019234078|nr:MADS-box protein FLOWERING LOCUS C-like [Hibiscus syriacus]
MGRGKVELKRIEDKKRRHVTFWKRKNGLIKKTRDLAVLCDVDAALILFSSTGLPYQFCTAQSLKKILDRYVFHVEGEAAICNISNEAKTHDELVDIRESGSLLEMVERKLEGQFIELLNITQLIQLENQLYSLLRETRNRKTQAMMHNVAAMKEKEKQLKQENDAMEKKIAARMDGEDGERVNQDSHYNSPQTSLWKGLLHLF